jgi:hypothetical protein
MAACRVAPQNGRFTAGLDVFCRGALALLRYIFQIFGANFDCGKLVNHLEGENESQSVAFSNQNTPSSRYGSMFRPRTPERSNSISASGTGTCSRLLPTM